MHPSLRAGNTLLLLDENHAFEGANGQSNHTAENYPSARWNSLLDKPTSTLYHLDKLNPKKSLNRS